jgi:hypothetical protein
MIGKAHKKLKFEETIPTKHPENKNKLALVDADTIAYAVCSVCESGDDEAGYLIDLDYALQTAKDKITGMLSDTGCGSAELHFTIGKNFRYIITDTYKANRTEQRTPEGLRDLKELLVSEYPGSLIHTDIEADDHVVWAKKYNPDKYILCAVDKDVYNSVRGTHWNYFARAKGKNKWGTELPEIKPSWHTTTTEESLVWFYMQVLMGDAGDGIKGIKGCGPLGAIKVLVPELEKRVTELRKEYKAKNGKAVDGNKLWEVIISGNKLLQNINCCHIELWNAVVAKYESAGMTKQDAIMTARLVSMHQINKEGDLELWTEPIQ